MDYKAALDEALMKFDKSINVPPPASRLLDQIIQVESFAGNRIDVIITILLHLVVFNMWWGYQILQASLPCQLTFDPRTGKEEGCD